MFRWYVLCSILTGVVAAGEGTSGLNADKANPWYPDASFPTLTTPQWVDESGVEAVVVLSIDDMRDSAKYEEYLRPIVNRLKQIDGRAPVSIMTCGVKPDDPQLQSWLEEGLSIEVHTADHPCPLLNSGDLAAAKSTYDRCVDQLNEIPGSKPVAFRTPCCDSLNTVSPRFYSEIFSGRTKAGHDLQIDSSVFNFFTSADPSIPRELVLNEDGSERFGRYRPRNNKYNGLVHDHFVNYIENYPYPYVINDTCWQIPCLAPSDWSAQHLQGVNNPRTIADWKAAFDITVHKQGIVSLVFHPHGWIQAEQIVELIDHAVEKHGSKLRFMTFREVAERLNRSLLDGKSLRTVPDAELQAVAQHGFRTQHVSATDYRSIPQSLRTAIEAGEFSEVPALRREDGSHNGYFVRDGDLCWQNEDTDKRPDLIQRVSLTKLQKRQDRLAKRNSEPLVPIGAAVVDITPDERLRLTGYGNRTTESEGVAAAIHARALVIGGKSQAAHPTAPDTVGVDGTQPLSVLVTVDNCGVPRNVTEAVFSQLSRTLSIHRAHFALSSTHTHSAPWLANFAPGILPSVTSQQTKKLSDYEQQLIEQLVGVVVEAVDSRRPGRLSVATGSAGFAINRRTIQDGRWTGFGETHDGPVDHQLPILAAHDSRGKLIAVLANYACHATTETGQFNKISGDWPGFAADLLEAEHKDAVALIAIGCGADANPQPRGTHEQAQQHGRTIAEEVSRLLQQTTPISGQLAARIHEIDLPLGPLPSREEWQQRAKAPGQPGVVARHFLSMLDNNQPIPRSVPDYPVQAWSFGHDLAMLFLGGEVVVDYAIRLNEMFDADRLWINAYSNDVPCYIASRRILREGGYEADSSMIYYMRPTRLAPLAEDLICDAAQKILPHDFYSDNLQAEFPAPKTPEESMSCITVNDRLRVELVAAEPLIRDPVAFDWDVQGRLWVVEMADYPGIETGDDERRSRGGRVRVLGRHRFRRHIRSGHNLSGQPEFPNRHRLLARWRDRDRGTGRDLCARSKR